MCDQVPKCPRHGAFKSLLEWGLHPCPGESERRKGRTHLFAWRRDLIGNWETTSLKIVPPPLFFFFSIFLLSPRPRSSVLILGPSEKGLPNSLASACLLLSLLRNPATVVLSGLYISWGPNLKPSALGNPFFPCVSHLTLGESIGLDQAGPAASITLAKTPLQVPPSFMTN